MNALSYFSDGWVQAIGLCLPMWKAQTTRRLLSGRFSMSNSGNYCFSGSQLSDAPGEQDEPEEIGWNEASFFNLAVRDKLLAQESIPGDELRL